MYYECHITIRKQALSADRVIEHIGWKHSAIDKDPVLGNGINEYATKHYKASLDLDNVIEWMDTAALVLKSAGFNVIRQKVELVLYDTKGKDVTYEPLA